MTAQSPQALLARLREHDAQTIIVDFDETLWLRNSTEEYLAAMRPAWLMGILLYAIEFAARVASRILQRLPGQRSANLARLVQHPGVVDGLRATVTSVFLPWHNSRWRRIAGPLGSQWINIPLRDALMTQERNGRRIIVSSLGFEHVIAPLLAGAGIHWELISSRSIADRGRGKLGRLTTKTTVTKADVSGALVITDSTSDQDLLDACGEAWLVRWPDARYARAHAQRYMPLYYTHAIKHPDRKYFLNAVLKDDFAFWVLALPWTLLWPAQALASLFILLSFWCVYEQGYRENDALGALHEDQPVLSAAFHTKPLRPGPVAAWLWALGLGLLGAMGLALTDVQPAIWVAAFSPSVPLTVALFLAWVSVLLVTRAVFYVFNRLHKKLRTPLFMVMQCLRNFALALLAMLTLPGFLALLAHTIARSVPYALYRLEIGRRWPKLPIATLRLGLYTLFVAGTALSHGTDMLAIGPTATIAAWCVIRCAGEWRGLRRAKSSG